MIDLAKEIWQTMRTNKLRTLLTGMSVAWGVFMLILLLSISKGVVNSSEEMAQKNDPYRITIWGGTTSLPYKGYREGRSIPLKEKYFEAIKESDPAHITSVEGSVSVRGTISTNRDFLSNSSCIGAYPSMFTGRYKLLQGRYINEADIRSRRKVAVLHKNGAKVLFADPDKAVGRTVNIGSLCFTVIGVYDHDWEEDSYIPYTTASAINGFNQDLDNVQVHITGVSDEEQSGAVETQVTGAMAKAAQFDPADGSAIYTFDRYASYVEQQKASSILNAAMWVIGILTLITGIVGVSNIMFVSVRERTHEIGIRRAIGAKPRSILVQVVLESVVLTTCFGYIGIVMGTLATEIVKKVFEGSDFLLNPTVDMRIAVEVTLALIAAGALAGIFPALRAIKVKPVEALRDE